MAGNNDAFAAGHGGAGGAPVNRDSGEVQVYDEQGRKTTAPEGSGVSINGKTLSHEEFADLARTNPEMHRQISGLRETGRVAGLRENEGARRADVVAAGGTVGEGLDHPAVKAELAKIAAGKVAPSAPKPAPTERPSRTPANRVRGTVVEPALPGMKLVNHADKTHRQYHTVAATLAASKDPVVADMGNTALTHLEGAKAKIEEAKKEYATGGGAQHHGNERVIEAHPLIQAAHDTLDNEYVRSYGERAGVNTELPHDSLAKLKDGVDTAPVLKKAASMPDINFGGKSRRLDDPAIKEAEKRARTDESPVAQAAGAKIRTAKRGTPRMYSRDRNTPVEGSVTGEDMEATTPMGAGRSGRGPSAKKPVSSTPRMTPVTRVRTPASKSAPKTNVSNGSKVGVTPKFDATTEAGEVVVPGTPKPAARRLPLRPTGAKLLGPLGAKSAPGVGGRQAGPEERPVQGPAGADGQPVTRATRAGAPGFPEKGGLKIARTPAKAAETTPSIDAKDAGPGTYGKARIKAANQVLLKNSGKKAKGSK